MNPSPAEITSPDYWQKMPRDIIAARVWAQSSYHYNNIERLIADYSRLAGELARVEKERDLYREGYEAFMVRPGHDRQRTCYEGDGWGRIRAAVQAIEGATQPTKEQP